MKIKDLSFLSIRRIPSQELKSRILVDTFREAKFLSKMSYPLGSVWYGGMRDEFEKDCSSVIPIIEEWLETELSSDEISNATTVIL